LRSSAGVDQGGGDEQVTIFDQGVEDVRGPERLLWPVVTGQQVLAVEVELLEHLEDGSAGLQVNALRSAIATGEFNADAFYSRHDAVLSFEEECLRAHVVVVGGSPPAFGFGFVLAPPVAGRYSMSSRSDFLDAAREVVGE
jgi:hypothetical protein